VRIDNPTPSTLLSLNNKLHCYIVLNSLTTVNSLTTGNKNKNKNGSLQVEEPEALAHAADCTHPTAAASFQIEVELAPTLLYGHARLLNVSQRQWTREKSYICPTAYAKSICFQSDNSSVGPKKASTWKYEAIQDEW
jgi:hypothetical protein